ncbi:type I methionyl aminopeptidase [Nocardioides sp. ChNu-153]|uniref:type I methionyl aminopeptidase n=1 Tax=unclassified Nocardioides TaxID=2615069 RepID=UPI00240529D2|nr:MULTISPECIES: type I methionyl aminopeptidase [unclassified Nocardioides]MDF9717509.1 type I methionyl aminopeptidase [Nocardioides sp. ChNu-99]MDN7120445.1 type I methionyl aminopeptidase [Nocardioides sp. ChNu-153]
MGLLRRGVELKTPAQLDAMREAGLVVGRTLELVSVRAAPGMTTAELDALAEESIRSAGAVPSFLGYQGFPASLCISVNDEVVHGIPGSRVLREGDVVSIDCGAIVDGWHGDAAVTVVLGEVAPEVAELVRVTEDALWRGIAALRLDGRVGDVSHAVESHVRSCGDYGVVEDYTGHGIGSAMHQPPDVPNVGRPGRGPRIVEGMALAIEPMVTLGSPANDTLDDDWTVVTRDGSPAAHFEHTTTVTPTGVWVLTALDGGAKRLADAGIPYGGR